MPPSAPCHRSGLAVGLKEELMTDNKADKMWQCPACGLLWSLTPEEEAEFVCFCAVSDVLAPYLRMSNESHSTPKPMPKQDQYQLAQCPFCNTWWRMPTAASLPPECDCQQSKQQRRPGDVSKPDPLLRFIEDELDFD